MAGNQYEITAKDGSKYQINANDDAEAQRLETYINGQIDAGQKDPTQWKPENAEVLPAQIDPNARPVSEVQGFTEGVTDVLNNAAGYVETGLDKVGGVLGLGDLGQKLNSFGPSIGLAGSVADAEKAQDAQLAASPNQSGQAGYFAGQVAGTLPLSALPGGVLAQGAAGGALLSESDTARGIAGDALLGAVGGKVGQAAFSGAAKLAAPVLSDTMQTLVRAGARATPGQLARSGTGLGNRIMAAAEDRASSLPGVGDMITADRVAANQSFNAAAINRALEPIGAKLPDGVQAGRRAIRFAGDTLSAKYDELLPGLRATGDDQFASELASIHDEAASMLPERTRQFDNILRGLDRYWQDGVNLDGAALKAIETRIGEKSRRFAKSQDADQQELGDALESVLSAVRELAARQNPDKAVELRAVNQGWASLTQVERAGLTTRGEFGPGGYSQAVRRSSATTRSRGYARGEALNQDLSDAASEVLPSEIPDSGTSGRWAQSNLLGLAAGALGSIPYAAARGVGSAMQRQSNISPELARLLQYGAQGAPVAAPALIQNLRSQ